MILSDGALINLDMVNFICVAENSEGYYLEADFNDRYVTFGKKYLSKIEAKEALEELSQRISEERTVYRAD